MSSRGYDPFVQALRLHEQNASVCTSRALAFCRSWPCLRNTLQPRISTRYSTAPTAKRVLMSIRGYDPLVQVLRLHEQNASVCTSRALAFCKSWPCLRSDFYSQEFLQDTAPLQQQARAYEQSRAWPARTGFAIARAVHTLPAAEKGATA